MAKRIILFLFIVLFAVPCFGWPSKGVAVSKTVSQLNIYDSVFIKIEWNAVNINIDNSWDSYYNEWKPGLTGWAVVKAKVLVTGDIEDQQNIELHLFKNGQSFKSMHMAASGHGAQSIQLNEEFYAQDINDVYDIRIFQRNSQGNALTINSSGGAWAQTCSASFSIKD